MENCKKCGVGLPSNYLERWLESDIKEIIKQGYCFYCASWMQTVEIFYDKGKSIIINGEHYYDGGFINKKINGGFLGFGGRMFFIKMNEGKVLKTNNLWNQGNVPEHFKDILKDNAEFITEEEYNKINNNEL